MENAPAAQAPHISLLQNGLLFRAEQVHEIPSIPAAQKDNYIRGFNNLWSIINSRPHTSPEYQTALKKLNDVSANVRSSMEKLQADNQKKQNGGRPMNPGQPLQPVGKAPQTQLATTQPPGEQVGEKSSSSVESTKLEIPPQLWSSTPEEQEAWRRETKQKYAFHFGNYSKLNAKLPELRRVAQQREQQGQPLTQEEVVNLNNRRETWKQTIEEARRFIETLKSSQRQWKMQREAQEQASSSGGGRTGAMGEDSAPNIPPPQVNPSQSQSRIAPDQQSRQSLVSNAALEAARNQANHGGRASMVGSPSTNGNGQQQIPSSVNQSAASNSNPSSQGQMTHHPNVNMNMNMNMSVNTTIPTSQHHSPQTGQPPTTNSSLQQGPYALSHKDAVEKAARSYSQPNISQSTPQSATHAHPQSGNRELKNNIQLPIPQQLNLPPPQPVSMGPARPTLSGGASTGATGPMGQPGISKHPGFVLEGEGERVLSKKKLEELVRQVTGGADGEGSETLHPDVEETLLDVADEFVDNVIMAACRLAKLRQSSTLELRDLQLVLERNYNIRVPGYSLDELRTVKKIQPSPAWTQKMSAVQAAKVTGGKTDL